MPKITMIHTKPEYISKAGLRRRGWTPSLIKNWLGKPDIDRDNGKYWTLARVEAAERSDSFKADLEQATKRVERYWESRPKAIITSARRMRQMALNMALLDGLNDIQRAKWQRYVREWEDTLRKYGATF